MAYPEAMSELTNYPKALSHAESGGGGFTLKSVTIQNGYTASFQLCNYIRADGKWIESAPLAVNESVTVYYPEPAGEIPYGIEVRVSGSIQLNGETDGFVWNDYAITADASAKDGASIEVVAAGSPK